jgi:hypothetical protein
MTPAPFCCDENSADGEIDRREFTAIVNFNVECQPVTFVERMDAGPFNCADVNEAVGSAIITLDKAETLRRIEEFDFSVGALTGQFPARSGRAIAKAAAARATITTVTPGARRIQRHRFAINLEIDGRNPTIAVNQRKAERLT